MFSKFKEQAENRKREFLSNCRDQFIQIYKNGKDSNTLTIEEYKDLTKDGANSYERYLLMEIASQELVVWLIRECLKNASRLNFEKSISFQLHSTYDEVLCRYLIHKL